MRPNGRDVKTFLTARFVLPRFFRTRLRHAMRSATGRVWHSSQAGSIGRIRPFLQATCLYGMSLAPTTSLRQSRL